MQLHRLRYLFKRIPILATLFYAHEPRKNESMMCQKYKFHMKIYLQNIWLKVVSSSTKMNATDNSYHLEVVPVVPWLEGGTSTHCSGL